MPEISESHWHKPDRMKRCILCDESKQLSEFYSYGYVTNQGKKSTRYESRCRPCAQARRMDRYVNLTESEKATSQDWKLRNKKRLAEYSREKQKDPAHRRMKAKSQRLRKARMRSGQPDDPQIRAIYDEAMRIEQVIANCPVFDLPELGKKMHVDHKIPLARGGLHIASNLQILPAGINLRKGTKCPR